MITGSTENSRLLELRKYTITDDFTLQYISGGDYDNDGVDYSVSPDNDYVVYYIGGIQFIDETVDDVINTTFNYTPNNDGSFDDLPIVKNPNKSKVSVDIKIDDDVFIVRNGLSAFEKNYRLEYINNLVDLTTYAGGQYFNIISNT